MIPSKRCVICLLASYLINEQNTPFVGSLSCVLDSTTKYANIISTTTINTLVYSLMARWTNIFLQALVK